MEMMLFLAVIYFIPTLVAASRDHHNRGAIVALNIFLGWTFIGWVIALVWALTAVEKKAAPDGTKMVDLFDYRRDNDPDV